MKSIFSKVFGQIVKKKLLVFFYEVKIKKWCTPMYISCQKSEIIELKNGWKLSVYSFVAVSSTIRFVRVYLDEKLV